MPKYIVKCDIEKEIEADTEYDAMAQFYDDLAMENDCIDNHITVEEAEPKKFRVTKSFDNAGDLREETYDLEAENWEEAATIALEDNNLMVRELKGGAE